MAGRFRGRFRRDDQGGLQVRLPAEERALLRSLAAQLRELLDEDTDPALARLSPPAYDQDDAHEAEYQAMVGDDLATRRLEAIAVLEATAEADHLDEDAVSAWMRTINVVRLVLGTRLGVSDDADGDPDGPPEELDPDDPEAPAQALYGYLSGLLSELLEELLR